MPQRRFLLSTYPLFFFSPFFPVTVSLPLPRGTEKARRGGGAAPFLVELGCENNLQAKFENNGKAADSFKKQEQGDRTKKVGSVVIDSSSPIADFLQSVSTRSRRSFHHRGTQRRRGGPPGDGTGARNGPATTRAAAADKTSACSHREALPSGSFGPRRRSVA
ncbi:hypothetical protein MRX96_005225 [Rhipicephalus microplus]